MWGIRLDNKEKNVYLDKFKDVNLNKYWFYQGFENNTSMEFRRAIINYSQI